MGLTWWPAAVAGAVLLAAVVAAAVLLPDGPAPSRGQPLAHTDRLTRLPEYRAALRRRRRAAVVTLALTTVLFVLAVVLGARPSDTPSDPSATPRDTMLCVAQPATDPVTGRFLGYFARQAVSSGDTDRFGLTSINRRLVPLTRDHQYTAGRLNSLGGGPADAFASPLTYTDYAPALTDVLALCLEGFPPAAAETRRTLVYLGPAEVRAPGDDRPTLYSGPQVTDLARRDGVRVDAVATPGRDTAALAAITQATGGTLTRADATGVDAALQAIGADAAGTAGPGPRRDQPAGLLIAALAVATLTAAALIGVRR